MAKAFMAYPELRSPFAKQPIHSQGHSTVIYQGKSITLSQTGDSNDLLIRPEDLENVNGFKIKPEGACFETLCIPLSDNLLVNLAGQQWFNLTDFADLLGQAYVADHDSRVWSFAEIPAKRENLLINAMVPNIEVMDRQGNVVALADLKGKKALIVTWSSW
jgi:hypothetical protein